MKTEIKVTHPGASMPTKAHDTDAGWDLYTPEDFTVHPLEDLYLDTKALLVDLGFSMAMEEGWEAQIRSRSSIACKKKIIIPNSPGTIDCAYRGNIMIPFLNLSKKAVHFKAGDRIAQMVFAPVHKVEWEEVNELSESNRGEGGFGSSGN